MKHRSFVAAGALLALMAVGGGCRDAQNRPASASEAAAHEFGSLSVDQVAKLVGSGTASIFDCNSQERWKQSHVPGAKWVAFNKVQVSDLPADKSRQLVFYCANER